MCVISCKDDFNTIDRKLSRCIKVGTAQFNKGNYEKALRKYDKALDLSKRIYPDSSTVVVECKKERAMILTWLGNNEEALVIFKDVDRFYKIIYGDNSLEYASFLSDIANIFYSISEIDSALTYADKSLSIKEQHPQWKLMDDGAIYSLISLCYLDNKQYELAIEYAEQYLIVAREVCGEESESYLGALDLYTGILIESSWGKGYIPEIPQRIERLVVLSKLLYGENTLECADYLDVMSYYYYGVDSIDNAILYEKEVETIYNLLKRRVPIDKYTSLYNSLSKYYLKIDNTEQALFYKKKEVYYTERDKSNPEYYENLIEAYCSLAELYSLRYDLKNEVLYSKKANDYSKKVESTYHFILARLSCIESIDDVGDSNTAIQLMDIFKDEINEEVLNESLAGGLDNLLSCYYDKIGLYDKSIEYCQKYLNSIISLYGDSSAEYASGLADMASFHCHAGNYSNALKYYDKALALYDTTSISKYEAGNLFCGLARLMGDIGDYDKELNYYKKSLNYFSEKNYPALYATTLDNMAITYLNLNEKLLALEYAHKALKLRDSISTIANDPMVAYSYNNLAVICNAINEYSMALQLNEDALSYRKEMYGELHPLYIASLQNVADTYRSMGQYEEAILNDSIAYSLAKQIDNADLPEITYALYALSEDYYLNKEYGKALPYIIDFYKVQSKNIINSLKGINTRYKQAFWEDRIDVIKRVIHFCIDLSDYPQMAETAYNAVLMSKGLLLSSEQEFNRILETIQQLDKKQYIEEYQDLKKKISSSNSINQQIRDSLYNKTLKLEEYLLYSSPELAAYKSKIETTWEEVKNHLDENEIAVEFFLDKEADSCGYYYALILRKDWESPIIEFICTDSLLESINSYGSKLFLPKESQYAYNKIWSPLEKYINKGDTVFFAPDGVLYQTNIELLGVGNPYCLTDNCNIIRLSSTRELVSQKNASIPNAAVIYGGLVYDIDDNTLTQLHYKYDNQPAILTRGIQFIDSVRAGWNYLPYTQIEANQIYSQFVKQQIVPTIYTGINGTEESFKSLSGKNYSIIHLATHGFFLDGKVNGSNYSNTVQNELNTSLDPMLRSGLILSGGQKAWLGLDVPEGVEDGILLSKEISELDLSNVDIVILSACDTGLGDIKEDGVFGLQRAFKLSSVRTVIMSLWEIDDNVTSEFMALFYQKLLEGQSRHEAFKYTQSTIKKKYSDPYYWASFIMLD